MRKLIFILITTLCLFTASVGYAENIEVLLDVELEDIIPNSFDDKDSYDASVLEITDILNNIYVVVHLYEQGRSTPISTQSYKANLLMPKLPSHMPMYLDGGSFKAAFSIPEPPETGTYDYYFRVGYESKVGANDGPVYNATDSFLIKVMPLRTIVDYGLFSNSAKLSISIPQESDFKSNSGNPHDPRDPRAPSDSHPNDYEDPNAQLWGDPQPDDTILARMFTRLVKDFMGALWNFFGIQDPITLFFNVDPEKLFENFGEENMKAEGMGFLSRPDNSMYVDPTADDTFLYTFNDKEYSLINLMFNEFNKFLQIPYAVVIAIVGLLLFLKGYSSEDKSTIKMFLGSILFFPLLIKIIPYMLEPLFWLNYTIVRAVGSTIENGLGISLTEPFVTTLIGSGTALNSIGVIIGTFFLFAAVGLLNFQYFIRRFMLAILIMMFPIVAFLQVFPKNRSALRMWSSEFTANLFLQSAHSIVYLVFAGIVYHVKAPFLPVMAMLITLSTFSSFVRNLMGCQSNSNMAGNMLGISAIFGAGRIAGRILGGITGKSTDIEKTKTISQATSSSASSSTQEGVSGTSSEQETQLSTDSLSQASNQTTQQTVEPAAKESTGTAWGIAPRMQADYRGALKKAGALGVVGTSMLAGSIVGSSAAGSAGFGFGAMAGAGVSGGVIKGASYTKDVAKNIYDRESKIAEIQATMDLDRRNAIIYAATGANATPEEVMFDEEMATQVSNFSDVAGFPDIYNSIANKRVSANAHNYLNEGYTFESVRNEAANLRTSLAGQNLSVPEVNNRVLTEVIRPAMKPSKAISQPLDVQAIKQANALKGWSVEDTYGGYRDMEEMGINAQEYANSFKSKTYQRILEEKKQQEAYNEIMRNYDPENW